MSKGGFSKQQDTLTSPEEHLDYFSHICKEKLIPGSLEKLQKVICEHKLKVSAEETIIYASLDTPAKVQEFLNDEIFYNWDHGVEDVEETTMSPRTVLQTGKAHCFEGAMFALGVNYLHGHNPGMVLLEASQDSEHNLIIVQDPVTGLFSANAHSAFPNLDGRAPTYSSVKELSESYYPHYYSDRTFDSTQLTLVGYSDPFDMIAKYGIQWMASDDQLWDIYYTYIDDTVNFHYLFDTSGKSHLYPLIHALKERWIVVNEKGQTEIQPGAFFNEMNTLWSAFWHEFNQRTEVPTGKAKEIQTQFQKLTGTTPIDLQENADELQAFLDRGYHLNQILSYPVN